MTRWPEWRRAALSGACSRTRCRGSIPHLTIAENLAVAARRGGRHGVLRSALGRSRRRELADRVRELGLGLEDRLDTPVGALSGGQRQALTLLMATLVRPELLLLDEHTVGARPAQHRAGRAADRAIVRREGSPR